MQHLRSWNCSQKAGPPFDGGPAYVIKLLKYASNMSALPRIFQYHFRGNCESLCSRRVASSRLPSPSCWDCRPRRSHANQPALNPAQTLPHSAARVPERSFKLDMIASVRTTIRRPVVTRHCAQSSGRHNFRNMRRYRGFGRVGEPRGPPRHHGRRTAPAPCRKGLHHFSAAMPYFFSASALAYELRAQVCSVETAAAAALPNGGVTESWIEANVSSRRVAQPAAEPPPGESFPETFHSKWQPNGDRAEKRRESVRRRKR